MNLLMLIIFIAVVFMLTSGGGCGDGDDFDSGVFS